MTNVPTSVFTVAEYVLAASMTVAGALLHFCFCSAVVGLFGQPAATDAAFAAACAFLSVADALDPLEIVTLTNLPFCNVAASSRSCLSCAVSGTDVVVVVLVVELAGS